MPHRSREIIEGYILEVISRSQTIQERCKRLLSAEFASSAPVSLVRVIDRMCQYLEDAAKAIYRLINWETTDYKDLEPFLCDLRDTDTIIRSLGANLRCAENARTQIVPWSVVKPIEKFIRDLLPEITVMLTSEWEYNYSIAATDLSSKYRDDLDMYQDLLPAISLEEKVFQDFKQPFHMISFPSLERKNILLHCLIGHEIGHLISKTYINKDRIARFEDSIRDIVNNIVKSKYIFAEQIPLFIQNQIKKETDLEIKRASFAWQVGLAEILSDIVGTLLFGPAMLFSAFEIAIQYNIDQKPHHKNSFYPPWRLRLREILRTIDTPDQKFFPLTKSNFESEKMKTINSVNQRFELIKKITHENEKKEFQDDQILKTVYKEIDKNVSEAKEIFYKHLEYKVIKPSALYKKLPHLIDRINNKIPPNAYEDSISNREPATIVEIINAVWFHKISWEDKIFHDDGSFNKDICKDRDRMNRLTLKAIEYADVEKEFMKQTKI